MRLRGNSWRFGLLSVGTLLLVGAGTLASIRPRFLDKLWQRPHTLENVATATVRRADLHGSLRAGGLVESSNDTVIECELESLDARVRGQGMASGGASTILFVIPEGTTVRKGDVLCRLDSSEFEEMVRQQRMNVERARADFRTAELNLEVARLAVGEFRDGNMLQDLKEMKGLIALAASESARLLDRLGWSQRMVRKGYVAAGQVANDEVALNRATIGLTRNKLALEIYERFTAPRTLRVLGSEVLMAESLLSYQTQRLALQVDRLASLERQVERCTIRAPHDGLLVYANVANRDVRIEAGAAVRQRQRLFLLPDLSRMEVETLIHETVVEQVENGQRVKVRVEALPDDLLEGHVVSVAQLASRDRRSEVPYYVGIVKLDSIPRGLRPGMSAEVEIATGRQTDVLAIPPEALSVETGHSFCYVARDNNLERRAVHVGHATRDLLEVTRGLEEGEEVVLDPDQVEAVAELTPAPGRGTFDREEDETEDASATH